jgi:3-oxoadipate enol-lactonase
MQRAIIGDINVAFTWAGRPVEDQSAPVVLMAHALGANHQIWDWQLDALSEHFRILLYDWRGHGQTDAPPGPYDLPLLVRDAIGLLDHLDINQVHWVGLSTGGMIGQGMALAHPGRIASLALCNTMARASEAYISFAAEREAIVRRSGLSPIWPMTHHLWFSDGYVERADADYRKVMNMFLSTAPDGYIGSMHAVSGLDYLDQLSAVTAPTLVLAAGDDAVATPAHTRQIADAIPGARYELMTGLRHYSNVEAPDAFNALLRPFLLQCAGDSAGAAQ